MVMGRPPVSPEKRRSNRVTIRLSAEEKQRLDECQKMLECSQSDAVNKAVEVLHNNLTENK